MEVVNTMAEKDSPKVGTSWRYYQFCHEYALAVRENALPRSFKKSYQAFEIEPSSKVIPKIIFCSREEALPNGDLQFKDRYKGISWQMRIIKPSEDPSSWQIFFHANAFEEYLATRLILVPYLRYKMVKDGHLPVLGSAFTYKDKTYILIGPPKSGKTTLLLQALKNGAGYLGDHELMIATTGKIQGVFDDIELRYPTAKKTLDWKHLPMRSRAKLACYDFLAGATYHMLGFNITLKPEHVGIHNRFFPRDQPIIFVSLQRGVPIHQATTSKMLKQIIQHEEVYQTLFPNPFYGDDELKDLQKLHESMLPNCSLWNFPLRGSVSQLLELK